MIIQESEQIHLPAADLRAVEAIGATLAGSGKPFVVTSGTLMLAIGRLGLPADRVATEDDAPDPAWIAAPRVASEIATIALAPCFILNGLSYGAEVIEVSLEVALLGEYR